jgi:2-(1,2-epoxy-1,2-dihydrophenyl)acetyl-CoA isomerase
MVASPVQFSIVDDVGIITLNRPEARNALTAQMVGDLGKAVQSCQNSDVRAVLITGSGDAFCSGADVKVFVDHLEASGPEAVSQNVAEVAGALHTEVIIGLRRLGKPVVAAVNGVAAGAGFSLTLACDLRIAASTARFFMAYANIGATADGGSTYFLPRLVGAARAMEMYLASQPISAESALAMGLVSQVCPRDELEGQSMEIAARLARGPTLAYGRVKALFQQSWGAQLEDQLEMETREISEIALTRDFQEGVRAFTEKRQARFQGT